MSDIGYEQEATTRSESSSEPGPDVRESRIGELRAQLAGVESQVAAIRDQYVRLLAELKEYRERQRGPDTVDAAANAAPEVRSAAAAGQEMGSRERLVAVTDQALAETFPGRKFRLLSTTGTSGNVYEGDDGLIYKVGIQKSGPEESYDIRQLERSEAMAQRGDYLAEEAAKLKYLHERGLAPKPVGYFNSRSAVARLPWYRRLLRHGAVASLPILIMEKVDFDPEAFARLSREERLKEAERIAAVLGRDSVWAPGDTEPVVDKRTGRIVFIDAGGWLNVKEREVGDVRKCIDRILEIDD